MPQKIVLTPSGFQYRDLTLPPIGPKTVRVNVSFAAPKHGTETHLLTGSVFDSKRWDPDLRMFLDKPAGTSPTQPPAERAIGNMVVGTVIDVGPEVTLYKPGDRVFGYGQIQEQYQADEDRWYPLKHLAPEDAVCVDPAHVALVAIRDGNLRVGDNVAIYGLGAIGLMAVRIARVAGAYGVFAVDPLPLRRACAGELGADGAFDPTITDAALAIKQATAGKGVDVAIETSGSGRALHDSIRCIRQCGTVVHVPWGPHDCTALHMDEEFHVNRPTLVGSQAWEGWGNPDRSHPLWDPRRAFAAAIELFYRGMVSGKPVVKPIVPFASAAEALEAMLHEPWETVKIGIAVGG